MSIFGIKSGLFADVIRCDETSYLIWKWKPSNGDKSNRSNSIRWGSTLHIKDSEAAVFVYNDKNGIIQEFIEGPYNGKLETKNLPLISDVISSLYAGNSPFPAEVYFINLAGIMQVGFGVPYFDIFDSNLSNFGVPTAVRGNINFRIDEPIKFCRLNKLNNFNLTDFQMQIRNVVIRSVKNVVANAPSTYGISVLQLESKIDLINEQVELIVKDRLSEDFGVYVTSVDINAIEANKDSEGYKTFISVTRDLDVSKLKADNDDYVERKRILREEEEYATYKAIQSSNIDAYKIEAQKEIGVAAAKSLANKNVVENASNFSKGLDVTSLMTEVAIGKTIGKSIANSINDVNNLELSNKTVNSEGNN